MNRHFLISVYTIAFACASVSTALADTIRVPGDQPTIQAGINAAAHGDVVLIADGVYTGPGNKNLDFHGKAITVRSENGRDTCIIDCEQDGRAFYFHSGEGADSVLEGLTIRNGRALRGDPVAESGAGILCVGSSPTINRCGFQACFAEESGGGIRSEGGSPRIRSCSLVDNYAPCGGGVSLFGGTPSVIDCEFIRNRGSKLCGASGLDCVQSNARIIGCSFADNEGGPALQAWVCSPLIFDCSFVANRSDIAAAIGVYPPRGGEGAWIDTCRFAANSGNYGGAVFCTATTIVTNCEFFRNSAISPGAAIGARDGTIIDNCTFVENSAVSGGGAVSAEPLTILSNCIFWDNGMPSISGSPSVSYSLVQGGWPGEGNIDLDPRFVDLDNGDLHLLPDSPAIDAGDPAFVPMPGETDIDGQARVWNGRIDMGSDEFGSFAFGDLNCDERFDAFDIEPFLLALFNPAEYHNRFPDCDINLGDINGDGSVNAFDIEPFLGLLFP